MLIVTHDIEECISMCNKIIVLSKRPSTIKKIFDIDLDEKLLPTEKRKLDLFNKYYDIIWKEMNNDI